MRLTDGDTTNASSKFPKQQFYILITSLNVKNSQFNYFLCAHVYILNKTINFIAKIYIHHVDRFSIPNFFHSPFYYFSRVVKWK